MNRRGFTLLEILIAITILATLMAFTAQTVIRSSRDKARLQREIDRDARLTNGLRILERDINMAFHYRNFHSEIEKEVKKKSQQQTQQGPNSKSGETPAPPSQPGQQQQGYDFEPREYPQLTQFIGTESSIHFTSLSHVRTIKDSYESDQQEVGYYLGSCENVKQEEQESSQCLWRRSTPYIDDDVTKGGGSVLLLSGVEELRFRYYGEDKLDWVSSWRTDRGGDDVTRNHFPLAVEVTISVIDKGKESSVSTVIPILFPNNTPKPETPAPGAPGTRQGSNP